MSILINSILLSFNYFPPNKDIENVLEKLNLTFTGIYTVEYIIKQIALGSLYFTDSWNIFDFIIVCVSDTFIVIE